MTSRMQYGNDAITELLYSELNEKMHINIIQQKNRTLSFSA
ncbi:hypothetical protein XBO1_2520023 [Xenorhabdus bovienii str. oregonense]|uniref:Uncharacterized protein n=1 Tax=Xenorhabdus bovienii str. oregonense TaxID=1398202 RepID=A0A077NY09_XENBV|nr:hypothetical protein XBO1_2520023 [Xenorhabdus bovienii str. oregonense]